MKSTHSLSIPITAVGTSGLTVTFGATKSSLQDSPAVHFDTLKSPWLDPFLEEFQLTGADELKISGSLTMRREKDFIQATGTLDFEPMLECVRSLTLFREKVSASASGFFMNQKNQLPQQQSTKKSTHPLADEVEDDSSALTTFDLDVYYFNGHDIYLDEFLLDALQLAIPDLPMCRPDCKGLCTDCFLPLNDISTCPSKDEKNKESCRHFSLIH